MSHLYKTQSQCGRMTFAVLLGCVVFSAFVSFVYIYEVGKIHSTSRPIKRLVSRRTIVKPPEVIPAESVNRNIFNDDRPGAKKKPLLQEVFQKVGQFKRKLFPTKAADSDATKKQSARYQLSTPNSEIHEAYQSHRDSIPEQPLRSNDTNHDSFRLAQNFDQYHQPLNSQERPLLVDFPKFHFHDDVNNTNNDLWYPQWIRNQAQYSSDATSFLISHHKTFLNHIYAESAQENVNEDTYNVSYSNLNPPDHAYTFKELQCEMKRDLNFEHVNRSTAPFSSSFLRNVLPTKKRLSSRRHFRSCAVVSSSGALAAGRHGAEIDSHDAVFRFNAAPTSGFEAMVGGKTTFRILNSQVLAYPEKHDFLGDPLYRQQDLTLIIWDPGNYLLDMKSWFAKPDHKFLLPYFSFRQQNPKIPAYIVHPRWIWNQWKFLQRHGVSFERWLWGKPVERIYPNPPTSGKWCILKELLVCKFGKLSWICIVIGHSTNRDRKNLWGGGH